MFNLQQLYLIKHLIYNCLINSSITYELFNLIKKHTKPFIG